MSFLTIKIQYEILSENRKRKEKESKLHRNGLVSPLGILLSPKGRYPSIVSYVLQIQLAQKLTNELTESQLRFGLAI